MLENRALGYEIEFYLKEVIISEKQIDTHGFAKPAIIANGMKQSPDHSL